jgi:hypothetical protein
LIQRIIFACNNSLRGFFRKRMMNSQIITNLFLFCQCWVNSSRSYSVDLPPKTLQSNW